MIRLLVLLLLLCSGCSTYDYHLAALTESYVNSTQDSHLAALRGEDTRVCGYFPPGYGGFNISCR